jgi:hypothetical protein
LPGGCGVDELAGSHHLGSPSWWQYCAKGPSGVGVPAVVGVGTGLVLTVVLGRGDRLCSDRVGVCVGRLVGSTTGVLVCGVGEPEGSVVCAGDGVAGPACGEAVGVVLGALGVAVTDPLGLSLVIGAACGFGEPPSNTPIAARAQRFTETNRTAPPSPATTARTDGAPYRPTGPMTALPLPLTQYFQPLGAGGQSGSGSQVFGGTQLRRGGMGQFGGTTNRFTGPPDADRARPG